MAQPFFQSMLFVAYRNRHCGAGARDLLCSAVGKITLAHRHRRLRSRQHATGNITTHTIVGALCTSTCLRPRVLRVSTTSPAIARTVNPLILAIPALSWVVAVVETTTQIIQQNKIVRIVFLLTTFFCGISRAPTDHHLCSQRILCSAHARTRTRVH